jgi:hypothetical protein
MQSMSIDQLACYCDALQRIEASEQAMEEALSKATVEERIEAYWERFDRLISALNTRDKIIAAVLGHVEGQLQVFDKLKELASNAILNLVDKGLTPNKFQWKDEYLSSMQGLILAKLDASIKADSDFRVVLVRSFLEKVLMKRLPEFALEYRERGQPMVAQAMEELAEAGANDGLIER